MCLKSSGSSVRRRFGPKRQGEPGMAVNQFLGKKLEKAIARRRLTIFLEGLHLCLWQPPLQSLDEDP
jgi:hypothetical protein